MNYAFAWSVTWHLVIVACAYAAYAGVAFPAISAARKINDYFDQLKPKSVIREWFGFVLSTFVMMLIVIPGGAGILFSVVWIFGP